MRCVHTALLLAPALVGACVGNPDRHTLAALRDAEPDVTEVQLESSLDQAMLGYRKFLEEAPESTLTPEAMRRLADLKLEKEYGILGDGELVELPAVLRSPHVVVPAAADLDVALQRVVRDVETPVVVGVQQDAPATETLGQRLG